MPETTLFTCKNCGHTTFEVECREVTKIIATGTISTEYSFANGTLEPNGWESLEISGKKVTCENCQSSYDLPNLKFAERKE